MTGSVSTYLGFDYGEKRIGVAVGQDVTATANALEAIRVTDGGPDWSAIERLVESWTPAALVVGVPLTLDGAEQRATRSARRFGHELGRRFGLPVHEADERLTTFEARRLLIEAGTPGAEQDPVAARLILESWLSRTMGRAR